MSEQFVDDIRCQLKFENDSRILYSDSTLSGSIKFILNRPLKVQSIFVRLKGVSHIRLKKRHDVKFVTETIIYKTIYLRRCEPGSGIIEIAPNDCEYPFEYELPNDLPSSIETKIGFIRYKLNPFIDTIHGLKKFSENEFFILKHTNLNENAELKISKTETNKSFSIPGFPFKCFESQSIDMKVSIPFGGYIPGQNIEVTIETSNETDQELYSFCVALRRKITYHNERNVRKLCKDEEIIQDETPNGVVQLQNRIHKISLTVPMVQPTDSSNGETFNIQYYIQVTGDISCCYTNPVIKIPIVIGTVPLIESRYASNSEAIEFLSFNRTTYGLIVADAFQY